MKSDEGERDPDRTTAIGDLSIQAHRSTDVRATSLDRVNERVID